MDQKSEKAFVLLCFWSIGSQDHETIGFTVCLGPWLKKTLVLLCFFCCLPTIVAETISFIVFLGPWVKKPLVFIAFEQLWSEAHARTIYCVTVDSERKHYGFAI